MADMTTPTPDSARPRRSIVAAFHDQESAAAAERAVGDLPSVTVRVGEVAVTASKVAENQDESRGSSPIMAAAPMTAKTMKASIVGAVGGGLVGALLMVPVVLLLAGDLSLAGQLLLALVVGGAAGATVGWLSGGYLGGHVASQPMAAERGPTLLIDADADTIDRVVDLVAERDPIRIDQVDADGNLVETLAAEDRDIRVFSERLGRAYEGHDDPKEIVR